MKKIFILFFVSCALLSASQNLTNKLQACYPFNNNAQNFAATGSPLNGTLTNVGSTTGHTGSSNSAYRLNGSVGSYIELPDHPGLKSDSVFFSGWFRIDSLPGINFPNLEYLVYTSNGCTSNFEAYSLHIYYEASVSNHVFCLSKCGSNCGNKPQIISLVTPVVSNWYHVCFYITNSVMKLYVNGVFQSSVNHNVPFGYQAGKNVFLGVTNESNFNHPFKGAIDNVRFYNRELSQQEITQLYVQDPTCVELPTPVSTFSASQKKICSGGSITFTDQSLNAPTSWNWQFQGGNPASSTVSNPTVSFPGPGIYTVSLAASNASGSGNSSVQTITVSSCVSIAQNDARLLQITIYPNPAVDRVYVEGLGGNTLVVYDLLGRPVKYNKNQIAENVCEINLPDAMAGVYWLKITNLQMNCLHNTRVILIK